MNAGGEPFQHGQPIQRLRAVPPIEPGQNSPHLAGDAAGHGGGQIGRDPRRCFLRPAGTQRQVAAEPVDIRQDGVGAVERRLPGARGHLHAQPEMHGVNPPDMHQIIAVHLLEARVVVHRAAQARFGRGGVLAADVVPGPGLIEPVSREVVQLGVVRELRQARGAGIECPRGCLPVAGVQQAHGITHRIAHRDVASQPVRVELFGDPCLHALHEQLPGGAGAHARGQSPAGPGDHHGAGKPQGDGDRRR